MVFTLPGRMHLCALPLVLFLLCQAQQLQSSPVFKAEYWHTGRDLVEQPLATGNADLVAVNRSCVQHSLRSVAASCDNVDVDNQALEPSRLRVALSAMLHACVQFGDDPIVRRLRVLGGVARLYPELQRLGSKFSNESGIPMYFNFSTRLGVSGAISRAAAARPPPIIDTPDASGGVDAFITSPSFMYLMDQAGKLLDLSLLVSDDMQLKWFQIKRVLREQMVVYGNKVVAIPVTTSPAFLFYHRTTFLRDGLAVPSSWDQVLALAESYNGKDINGDGQPDFGICMTPPSCFVDGVILQWVFTTFVQTHGSSQGVFLDPRTMANLANTSAMVEALQVMRRLRRAGPLTGNCAVFEDQLYLEGRCLMSITNPTTFKSAYSPDAPKSYASMRGHIGMAAFPGSTRVLDRSSGLMVDCDSIRCPLASNTALDASGVLRPVNQPSPSNNVIVMMNAQSHPKYQFYAYSLFSYLSSPEVLGTAGAALLLDPRLETAPLREEDLRPQSATHWVARGYDTADVEAFFSAYRAAVDNPNQAFESKFPGNVNISSASTGAAVLFSNATPGYNPPPISMAAALVAQRVAAVVEEQAGLGNFTAIYRQTLNWVPPPPPPLEPEPLPRQAVTPAGTVVGGGDDDAHSTIVAVAVAVPCGVVLLALAGWAAWSIRRRGWARKLAVAAAAAPGAGPDTTLLVTDIQSSTSLWEHLPPEVMNRALSLHHNVMRKAIADWSGYESATEGDSFIIAFRNPTDALMCALAVQQALLEAPWPSHLLNYAPLPGLEGEDDPLMPVAVVPLPKQLPGGSKASLRQLAAGTSLRSIAPPLRLATDLSAKTGSRWRLAPVLPSNAPVMPRTTATSATRKSTMAAASSAPPSPLPPSAMARALVTPASSDDGLTPEYDTSAAGGGGGYEAQRACKDAAAPTDTSARSQLATAVSAVAPSATATAAAAATSHVGVYGERDGDPASWGWMPPTQQPNAPLPPQLPWPTAELSQQPQSQSQSQPPYDSSLYTSLAGTSGVTTLGTTGKMGPGGGGTGGGGAGGGGGKVVSEAPVERAADVAMFYRSSDRSHSTREYRVTGGSGSIGTDSWQTTMTLASSILASARIVRGGASFAAAAAAATTAAAADLDPQPQPLSPPGSSTTLFCGLRVRMGMWTGVPSDADVTLNAANRRTQYSGPVMVWAKLVSDTVHGGMVVMAECSRRRLKADVVRSSRHVVLYSGQHVVAGKDAGEEAGEAPPSLHLYTCYSQALLPRAVVVRPVRSAEELRPGALVAPVGHGAVAQMRVVGIDTLLAWNLEVASASLEVLHSAALRLLPATGTGAHIVNGGMSLMPGGGDGDDGRRGAGAGAVTAAAAGNMLVVFSDADGAVGWAAALRRAVNVLTWPHELLEHELGEEVWATAPTDASFGCPLLTEAAAARSLNTVAATGPFGFPGQTSREPSRDTFAGGQSAIRRSRFSGGLPSPSASRTFRSGFSNSGTADLRSPRAEASRSPQPRFRVGNNSSGGGGGATSASGRTAAALLSALTGATAAALSLPYDEVTASQVPERSPTDLLSLPGADASSTGAISSGAAVATAATIPTSSSAIAIRGYAASSPSHKVGKVRRALESCQPVRLPLDIQPGTSRLSPVAPAAADAVAAAMAAASAQHSREGPYQAPASARIGPTSTSPFLSADAAPGGAQAAASPQQDPGGAPLQNSLPAPWPALDNTMDGSETTMQSARESASCSRTVSGGSPIPTATAAAAAATASGASVAGGRSSGIRCGPGNLDGVDSSRDRYDSSAAATTAAAAAAPVRRRVAADVDGMSLQLLFRGLRLRWAVAGGQLRGALAAGDVSGQVSYKGKAFAQAAKLVSKARVGQIRATADLARTLPSFLSEELTIVDKP